MFFFFFRLLRLPSGDPGQKDGDQLSAGALGVAELTTGMHQLCCLYIDLPYIYIYTYFRHLSSGNKTSVG